MPKKHREVYYSIMPVEMLKIIKFPLLERENANCTLCGTLCFYDPKGLKYVLDNEAEKVIMVCMDCTMKSKRGITNNDVKRSLNVLRNTRGKKDGTV